MEIILTNCTKCFVQTVLQIVKNFFAKCLNKIHDCSSGMEYYLNYNKVCQVFEANRGLVKKANEKNCNHVLTCKL